MKDFTDQDHKAMALALVNAKKAYECAEVPVGAVLTVENKVVAEGFNQPIKHADPTAHAEIMALRQACKNLKNYRLPPSACLYVTLEPCTMCIGALIHARLPRLVFATTEPRAGAVVSQKQLLDEEHYNHRITYQHGLMAHESAVLLKAFFKERRQQAKKPK